MPGVLRTDAVLGALAGALSRDSCLWCIATHGRLSRQCGSLGSEEHGSREIGMDWEEMTAGSYFKVTIYSDLGSFEEFLQSGKCILQLAL